MQDSAGSPEGSCQKRLLSLRSPEITAKAGEKRVQGPDPQVGTRTKTIYLLPSCSRSDAYQHAGVTNTALPRPNAARTGLVRILSVTVVGNSISLKPL